jgi:hypothetical protein
MTPVCRQDWGSSSSSLLMLLWLALLSRRMATPVAEAVQHCYL